MPPCWILSLFVAVGLCLSPADRFAQDSGTLDFDQLRAATPALDLTQDPAHSPPVVAYFRRYQIEFAAARHSFGVFESRGYRVAAHVWYPANPEGSVFVLHGYLDHTGLMKPLIGSLLDRGFAVATYDLPGHGLSSGERAGINDFSEYAAVFNDFLRICRPHLPRPFHAIGHSTGCAVIFEYLHTAEKGVFGSVVFLAPLVHSGHWSLSKAGTLVAAPFLDTLPRMFRTNTSDAAYLSFVQEDPLRIVEVPIRWAKALYSWDERIRSYGRIEQPVLVVQGTDDDIVDSEYNIPFLRRKMHPISVKWVEGAKHQLVNERSDLRSKVLSLVRDYLDGSTH